MGQCYSHDHLKLYDAAAKCYRRAVTSGDHENIVLHKLAELYKQMNQHDAAFSCYKQNLEYIDQQNSTGQVRSCSAYSVHPHSGARLRVKSGPKLLPIQVNGEQFGWAVSSSLQALY
jgi:tetratricopeptide (TPR) repeat protein